MDSINYVIVEVENSYNNELKIADGVKLIVNDTIESVEHINRKATVISSPSFTILKEGDEIIMHHNICRKRNGVGGEQVESNYHIEDNKYFVPLTEVFMYRRDGEDWVAIAPFCFVKPIKKENKETTSSIITADSDKTDTHKGMVKNEGIMCYPNQLLIDQGIHKGDHIAFSDDSEYEFKIEKEIYYKMSNNDILGKFD